ncbi:hypothetical protein PK28_05970 [Hymenobacter sp. DG25B]|jgi:hypothetical protein|uniref:hypothetical protein n=1 Tax=Hymenobacter sp. DG25B TaxID=1385664 RepID=UPI0005411E49|nr:hypothetical protein [Hymenobacter sp. DG25B]AIZ65046.1 hypothetical protein PK28_05970 [Hymenobacter sp. DG25B]
MKNNSPHILNTSANLMGLCFIVLTSLKVNKLSDASIIDELTAVATLFFITSCILSFLSMRSSRQSNTFERLADLIFLGGLLIIFVTITLITLNIIR